MRCGHARVETILPLNTDGKHNIRAQIVCKDCNHAWSEFTYVKKPKPKGPPKIRSSYKQSQPTVPEFKAVKMP